MIDQRSEKKTEMGEIERDHDDLIRYLKGSDDGACGGRLNRASEG